MAKQYKIRSFRNGKNKAGDAFVNYSLTLPTPLAEKLHDDFGTAIAFEIELTEEGILYRPVEAEDLIPASLPFKAGKSTPTADKPKPPKATAPAKKPGPKPKTTNGKTAPKAAVKKVAAPKAPSVPKVKVASKKAVAPKAPVKPRIKVPA